MTTPKIILLVVGVNVAFSLGTVAAIRYTTPTSPSPAIPFHRASDQTCLALSYLDGELEMLYRAKIDDGIKILSLDDVTAYFQSIRDVVSNHCVEKERTK